MTAVADSVDTAIDSSTGDTRDRAYMWQALQLAKTAEGRTSPNPVVGAVIVRDDRVVATGYHRRAGEPHAEEEALIAAGDLAAGAELYVSLEPCCHRGRRRPCVEAVIRAGIRRVVVGVIDPNPLVSGKGLEALRAEGIATTCGVLEAECRRANAPFFKYIQTGFPYVTAKYAMSLDGKTATHSGHSQWISGKNSRRFTHGLRDRNDAILIGGRTLAVDDPRLTTRGLRDGRDPTRVVLDPEGLIAGDARVLTVESSAPTWVVCGKDRAREVARRLRANHDVIPLELDEKNRAPLEQLLRVLGERDIMSLLVEGGGDTLAGFFEAGQVDRVVAVIAPLLVGGRDAPTPLGGTGVSQMPDASRLQNVELRRVDDDLILFGTVGRWG